MQSTYACATAGGHQPFSSMSPRLVHLSEIGKFPGDLESQDALIQSVLNAIPPNGLELLIAVLVV